LETIGGHSFTNAQVITLLNWYNKNEGKYSTTVSQLAKNIDSTTTPE
jgi:hypothetical protein